MDLRWIWTRFHFALGCRRVKLLDSGARDSKLSGQHPVTRVLLLGYLCPTGPCEVLFNPLLGMMLTIFQIVAELASYHDDRVHWYIACCDYLYTSVS